MIVSDNSHQIHSVQFEAISIDREIEIIPISDLHFGDPDFNLQLFSDTLDYILAKENRYVILNGDLVNNALPSSPSDTWGEMMSPTEQILYVAEQLKPIKDRIISVVSGNHELRSWKNDGIDLTQWLCAELGIKERYDPNMCVDFITLKNEIRNKKTKKRDFEGKYLVTLNHRHGNAGGKKIGSKANALQDMISVIDCDIYLLGHSHQELGFKQDFFRIDRSHKKVQQITKTFVNCNAFLRFGGYGARLGFAPSTMQVPRIIVRFSNAHRGNDLDIRLVL